MPELTGSVAVVTGAGHGLGRAEALALGRAGAQVVVNDIGAAADDVVAEIAAAGGEAVAHHGDVGDVAAAGDLIATALGQFGGLHVLVNNAGITRDRLIFSMSEAEWDDVQRVHLKGHFATARAATAYWRDLSKKAGEPVRARVINTASEAALLGPAGQPNYGAAKAGIIALTLSIAQGCSRYGVTANAICPRARTAMTAGVFGETFEGSGVDPLSTEHVAPFVVFLAGAGAARISGQVFVVYGGKIGLLAAPRLQKRFDAPGVSWTTEDLTDAVGAYFEGREPGETFAATDVLSL